MDVEVFLWTRMDTDNTEDSRQQKKAPPYGDTFYAECGAFLRVAYPILKDFYA